MKANDAGGEAPSGVAVVWKYQYSNAEFDELALRYCPSTAVVSFVTANDNAGIAEIGKENCQSQLISGKST